ncbi:MAG: CHAT domain-containing protein [Nitrospinae bacterium]|nr:CHAT domain-containing protein [Nitrospinota bacterium]
MAEMKNRPAVRATTLGDMRILGTKLKFIGAFFFSGFLFLPRPDAWAAPARFNEPIQITANPGEDFAPAVSPDGKFMVYVSDRSGNLDLWLKELGPGTHPPDRQLTFHSAEDNSPAISPDGEWAAFVSNRSDPRGDIYLLPLGSSKAADLFGRSRADDPGRKNGSEENRVRLTDAATADADPVWSPDGKSIYFSSHDAGDGAKRIFSIDVKTRARNPEAAVEGVNPSVSPDGKSLAYIAGANGGASALWALDLKSGARRQITTGKEIDVSPRWSPDGKWIYFARYQDDTNFDGQVSIDDRPNVWRVEWKEFAPDKKNAGAGAHPPETPPASADKDKEEKQPAGPVWSGRFRQLTDSSAYDLQPALHGQSLYFVSNRKGSVDIWKLPAEGLAPRDAVYGKALQSTEDLCPEDGASYRCLMALGNVTLEFAGEKGLPRVLYRMGAGYKDLGHAGQARDIYSRLLDEFPDDPVYRGLAEIEVLLLDVAGARKEGPAAFKEASRKALEALDRIAVRDSAWPQVVSRAALEKGHLHFALEEPDKALRFYKTVIAEFPGQRAVSAEAAYSQSGIYSTVGDHDRLVESFVQVVRDYYDVGSWTQKAILAVLDLFEKQPGLEKKVSNLQVIVERYKTLPLLSAAAQNRVGELFYQASENLLAKEAYRKTVEQFPEEAREKFAAQFALARIFAEEENWEMSLNYYKQIAETSKGFEEDLLRAREGYVRKSLEKGKWELKVGEVKLAVKTYLKLIEFDPQAVEAHRGYIQGHAVLKKIDQVVPFYKTRLAANGKSAVDHYALGLAYTYQDPPALDAAEDGIARALTLNSQEAYFHQTLGWIYEQKERLTSNAGYLERSLQEYQIALALNDDRNNPDNRLDLLLNLGNGHYLLKNYFPAYHFYRERERGKPIFTEPAREAIYYQRYGESAFKSGYPGEAVELYRKALKLVSGTDDLKRMAELNDRIALAYQDGGHFAKAVEYFSRTLDLHRQTGNAVSLSRALRNIANNLYDLNRKKEGQDAKSLGLALGNYFQAIENLEKFGVARKGKEKEKTALIDVNVEVGAGPDASQAAGGFDKAGEQKLIFNYIGRIYGDVGEYGKAIEYYQKKLALLPARPDPKKSVGDVLEKAIILNQIGYYHYLSGDYDRATDSFRQSYKLSVQLENRQGIAVNAANVARVFLVKSGFVPLNKLRDETESARLLLEEADGAVRRAKVLGHPEYEVYLKNYLGIVYHYLALHFTTPGRSKVESAADPERLKSMYRAASELMVKEYGYLKESRRYFEEALASARANFKGAQLVGMETALKQNLELTDRLAGAKAKDKEVAGRLPTEDELLRFEWQFEYLDSLEAGEQERTAILLNAEKSLSRLPYGLLPSTPAERAMAEELYLSLVRSLFERKQFGEALYYSEKGLQRALASFRQDLRFKFQNKDRAAYYEEIVNYARLARDLANGGKPGPGTAEERRENFNKLLDDYGEFVAALRQEDEDMANLFSPEPPPLDAVRKFLKPGEVVVKFQREHDHILTWAVTWKKVLGGSIPVNPALYEVLQRLSRSGTRPQPRDLGILSGNLLSPHQEALANAKTVFLVAAGPLEFLPWPAMTVDGKVLVEKLKVVFASSLTQFCNSQKRKNLYNSRFLAAEFPEKPFARIAGHFASAVNLTGEEGTAERFLSGLAQYGVADVESKTFLERLDPFNSYISATLRGNHFERAKLEDLYGRSMEANFIALNDVDYEIDPGLDVSPAAPLLHGLDFMGYPGILLHFGPKNPDEHAEFLELFYSGFRRGNPADSLRQAQLEIRKRRPGSFAWAGYRFYGFPGMDEFEKNEFAKANFEANVDKGGKAFAARDWPLAIGYFEKALALLDLMQDKKPAPKIYKVLAQAAYNQEDYPKAIKYQQGLVQLMEKKGKPEEHAEAIYFLGILYSRAEEYPKAVENLKAALAIYEKNEALDKLAESYSALGIVEENALDYDKALDAFRASLRINEEIGEDLNRGRELRRIGRIYYLRLSAYGEARKYFVQANELFKKLGRADQAVETGLELGLVAEKEGNFAEALKFYREGQALAESKNLKPELSKAFLYQANSHWYQGDYQNAFKFQKLALEIAEDGGDKRQQTFVYNTLGLIYWTLNDSRRALTHLNHSLTLAGEIHSPLDRATAYNNIGLVYRKDKKYPESVEYFQKALEMDVQLKSKWGQGYTHRNLGMSFMRMGRLDEAEGHIKQAVALSSEIGNKTNLVKSMLEMGNLAIERKDCEKAVAVFRETGKMAEGLRIQEVVWRAYRGEGFCLARLKRPEEALDAYKKAVETVDQMRAAIKVEEFQNGFLTDKQDVYKELVLLLLDQGKVEESFNFAERAKSRSFIDLLGNQKISLKNDASQKTYEKLLQQKQAIRALEDSLAKAADDESAGKLKEQLAGERNRYQDLLIEVKSESPEISAFVTVDALTLQELYGLLGDDVALVEYLTTENELVAWIVVNGKIDVVRVPVKEAELGALVKDYRMRIQRLAPAEDQSAKLYEWVVKPAEKYFKGKRVLGIVPHGQLHYVSFASLRDAEGYLIEKKPIFYTPSASVLKFTFMRKFEKTGRIKALALGNPDLKNFNYDLPLAELEANAIRWDFPEIDVLTRDKATESWVHKHIGDYQIVHIASHGEFDSVNPLFSSLKLTSDLEQDGSLQASEVFALNIKADLVTLSACQTGLGEIVGGDELVGLNRAFIYAGTHAIISSLWRVSDISTAVLIKHFYRNYIQEDKAESLRKAQLLVKKLYPHPAYWAGFNLTGDYR